MKYHFISALVFLSSCSSINNTNYQKLTDDDRKTISSFNITLDNLNINYKDSFKVYEITYLDIMRLSEKTNKKIWIHFFAPWCNAVTTKDLEKLEAVQQRFSDNLILINVSTSYDFPYLKDLFANSKLKNPVYVLDGKKYGTSITKSQEHFYNELSKTTQKEHFDDYIIHNKNLIYAHPWKLPIDSFFVRLNDFVTTK